MEIYISTIMVLVAAIVAWTNYQQHLLTKEKFKLDLFEKRFAVYKGVQRFLTHILLKAKIELDKLDEFRGDTQVQSSSLATISPNIWVALTEKRWICGLKQSNTKTCLSEKKDPIYVKRNRGF